MNGVHWAGLHHAVWLPLFLMAGGLVIFRAYKAAKGYSMLAKKHHFLLRLLSSRRSVAKAVLMVATLVLVFGALLRPQWDKQEETILQEGRDVLVLLDVSGSMRAKDLKPDRLTFAKLKIRNLLQRLTCERVGLILFSGSAFLQCPMTADHAAFLMFLENVDAESISSGTTAIDQALHKALDTFKQAGERKNKLALLLTDGEDFSTNFALVQKEAAAAGLSLFALGIGTPEGAPIPKLNALGKQIGHETDENGSIALSKLNEAKLQEITRALHGAYQRASYEDTDLAHIVSFVQQHEKEQYEDRRLEHYHDQYPWLLGAAWLLLALEWLL